MAAGIREHAMREDAFQNFASCVIWLLVLSPIGIVAVYLATDVFAKWGEQEALRQRSLAMAEQLQQIRKGEIHCLVQPELDCIEEVLVDADCVANIEEVYLGGEVSDARLGRLRELPHLRSIILLFAHNPDVLLERLRGLETLEVLNLEHSAPSASGIEDIGSLPKLKALSINLNRSQANALEGLRNHASLENLTLSWRRCDADILPLLQSLPNLRSVIIEDVEDNAKPFEERLQEALPDCKCSVEEGR